VTSRANRSVETKIHRLTREIARIDEFFYSIDQRSDRALYAGMLERKRDDMVRSAVLQLHTAIEDVLTSWITCRMLGVKSNELRRRRTKRAQALGKMLSGGGSIGFDMKLHFAVALRLITRPVQERLSELNRLRNKCSHNWLLKAPVRRGKRPREKKPPLLLYKGRDLHTVEVLEDFAGAYGPLYARLFVKYLG
jgi:hypothetical protein